ncbi:PPE family protein [Mycobacterium servetii]|uniref:PPE family protein n=1 Tax=Mycobacterium servetii TaxID=3237418 RepID=A0ABV4BZ12_9MYCO
MFPTFPWLPPEINSALMYTGAGSGPLFTAASAWNSLAADLAGAASSFNSVVTGLSNGAWTGPASMSMAAAAVPYVSWLNAAASQAEAAGAQAVAAATGFETARSLTVPPAAVTANRVQLATLVATNFLGQNTPAIFATEFEYMEMWAQDVAAMFGYHGAATAAAAMLPAFNMPPTLLAGLSSLGGLLSAPLSGVSGLGTTAMSAISAPVNAVMSTGVLAPVTGAFSALAANPSLMSVAEMGMYPASMMMSPIMMAAQAGMRGGAGAGMAAGSGAALADAPKFVGDVAPKGLGGAGMGGLGAASAGLGKARLVGAMSVPPTWQGSSPARMVSAAMSGVGAEVPAGGAMPAGPGGGGMPMMPMPMGGMGGAAGGMPGGMLGRGGASPNHVVQSRPSVVPRTGVG